MARPLSNEARTKTLSTALAVLQDLGVEGFTVDEVARRSGVAKSTIYRHFSSTSELMLSAFGCLIVPLPTPNTGSLRGDLLAFLDSHRDFMTDESIPRTFLGLLNRSANDADFAEVHNAFVEEQRKPIKTMIQLAQGRGEVHPDLDLDIAMDVVEGPFMLRKIMRFTPIDEASAIVLIDLAVAALTKYRPSSTNSDSQIPGDT